MKTRLILIAAGVLLVGLAALAQSYSVSSPSIGLTWVAHAGKSNAATSTAVFDCSKQQNVALQIGLKCSGACTTNMVYALSRSVDGSTFDTEPLIYCVVPANGATTVYWTTNMNLGGARNVRLEWIENKYGNVTMTNLLFKFAHKIGAE